MEHIVGWVKNYILVFFLMSVLLSLVSKKEYKSYIRFFMEMVLIVALVTPILGALGKSEDFLKKIEYDRFWQELNTIQTDEKKMNYINEEYYIDYYEEMVAKDALSFAKQEGYEVEEADVVMDGDYQILSIGLKGVWSETDSSIKVEQIGGEEKEEETLGLQEKVAEYYQLETSAVTIKN